MDAIALINPVAVSAPIVQAPAAPQPSEPVVTSSGPAATTDLPIPGSGDNAQYNPQAGEQKRLETVQHAAQDIANIYIVGDKTFTIFKDATGQYITRFTSLRDGKVTYIPEPELFKRSSASPSAAALNIQV